MKFCNNLSFGGCFCNALFLIFESKNGFGICSCAGMENDHEKENINLVNGTNGSFEESSASSDGPNDNMQNGDSESEQKISVKERMQKFNRIASESELAASKMPSNRHKREIAAKVK